MPFTCPRCSHVSEDAGAAVSCPACGHTSAALTDVTAAYDPEATAAYLGPGLPPGLKGRTVGGFRLLRQVGAGGMGAVFEAEQLATGRRVALKLIRPEIAASGEAVDRFRREGRLASAVTHPRCVFVLTADEDAGQPYIVLELMPGDTLKDLVARQGPLAPADAVAKVLDAIEGLQELHRRGIIHRDVKPANCFLEADGRVKVGDFGLARSLLAGADPAEQGRFLGTPLFASPEQLKGEPVDERTDVYALAATLYYLLTGRAPFQGGGPATVIARATSEPAPPMRRFRPELPRGLDRVVLRGLERDRRRRWQDLEQLRRALLRFLPARPSVGGMGLRLAAFLIDYVALIAFVALLNLALANWGLKLPYASLDLYEFLLASAPDVLYFTLLEGLFGCALGKWLLRLRVCRRGDLRPPGLVRAALRTAVFYALFYLPHVLVSVLPLDCFTAIVLHLLISTKLGGIPLVMLTMRERNGYRGLHEFLSGTRVVRLTPPGRKPAGVPSPDRLADGLLVPQGAPAAVGPFRVLGALRWADGDGVLLGEDALLDRKALLWVRPAAAVPLTPQQQEVARPTRLRWLAEGTQGATRWDAFVALGGCPLPDLVADGRPLKWGEARPILQQLADEVTAACADGSLPRALSAAQVWVRPDGQVHLLAMTPCEPPEPQSAEDRPDEERALALLGEAAARMLEGRSRSPGDSRPIQAPLPAHAARMLARLLGAEAPYHHVEEFRADLAAAQDRPTTVTRSRRFVHLLAQGALLFAGLVLLYVLNSLAGRGDKQEAPAVGGLGLPLLSLLWAALVRGGPSFGLCALALVRGDGRRAARWQAALRALLVWVQGFAVLVAVTAGWAALRGPPVEDKSVSGGFLWAALIALCLYALLTAWLPRRTLHDRLARTYIMPR
jgi:hypothetical protein